MRGQQELTGCRTVMTLGCDTPLAPVERGSVYGKEGGCNFLMRSRYVP